MSSVITNNGENTDKQSDNLVKERLVVLRKHGITIALNPYAKNIIKERIRLGGFEL